MQINLGNIEWKALCENGRIYSFHARVWACAKCASKFTLPKMVNTSLGQALSNTREKGVFANIEWSTKGYDVYSGSCDLCGDAMSGGGEEMYFTVFVTGE